MSTSRREASIRASIVLGSVSAFAVGIGIGATSAQPQAQQQPSVIIIYGAPEGASCVPAEACRVMSWAQATGTLKAEAPR